MPINTSHSKECQPMGFNAWFLPHQSFALFPSGPHDGETFKERERENPWVEISGHILLLSVDKANSKKKRVMGRASCSLVVRIEKVAITMSSYIYIYIYGWLCIVVFVGSSSFIQFITHKSLSLYVFPKSVFSCSYCHDIYN